MLTVCKQLELKKEKNSENEMPILQLPVSEDDTWKKRGFNSIFEVISLKVKCFRKAINTVVRSSFCEAFNGKRKLILKNMKYDMKIIWIAALLIILIVSIEIDEKCSQDLKKNTM